VVVAELAVIALVRDPFEVRRGKPAHVSILRINAVKQGGKGGIEVEATPAAVADLVDPMRLLRQVGTIPPGTDEIKSFHVRASVYLHRLETV